MIYHYIESLLTMPLLFAILSTLVEFRFPRKKCILIISATITFIFFITVALNLLGFSQMKLYTYVWFITGIPSFLCIFYLAKYRDGGFLFVFLSEFVLAGFCTIFSFIAAYYLPYPDEIEIIFLHFIFLSALYLIFRLLFRDKYFPAARTRGNLWYLYCLLPLFSLLLFKMYSTSPGQKLDIDNKVALPYLGYIYPYSFPFLIVLLAMFCYLLILIMLMITYNHRIAMEREEKMHLDFFADTLNQKLLDTEEKNDRLRILRHDIHFHINAISAMIQNNKIDDAKTYLHDLGVIFDQTKAEKYCLNPVINAILDFFAGKLPSWILIFYIPSLFPTNCRYQISIWGLLFPMLWKIRFRPVAKYLLDRTAGRKLNLSGIDNSIFWLSAIPMWDPLFLTQTAALFPIRKITDTEPKAPLQSVKNMMQPWIILLKRGSLPCGLCLRKNELLLQYTPQLKGVLKEI